MARQAAHRRPRHLRPRAACCRRRDRSTAPGEAGEVRLIGAPASIDEARRRVREAAAARGRTCRSRVFRWRTCSHSRAAIIWRWPIWRARSESDGLEAVAEAPLDVLGRHRQRHRGRARRARTAAWPCGARRSARASIADRLDLIERAVDRPARDVALQGVCAAAAPRSRRQRRRPATTMCGRLRWRG